ncbi:hypothetical protein A9Q75_03895 [Colwellia psychrerythraea]|uniref:Uncharacterized protein n=1 Tax=Colwellia psychrerythraea TaxID=28229 RepID=A0A1Y5EM40_COLPS|nr:hypothetical protein A9Q75_03895 [Colwellia psychrerythraea]
MQLFIGFVLVAFGVFLFFIDIPLLAVISFFIGFGVLRGYRKGKIFYLIGGRSNNGSCCG